MGLRCFLLINDSLGEHWEKALRSALNALGKLETASQHKALELLECGAYELVFIDATVVAEFAEVVRELRQRWPTLPIIVAATAIDWTQAREAFRAGATDYICKSHDQQELFSVANVVLEQCAPSAVQPR